MTAPQDPFTPPDRGSAGQPPYGSPTAGPPAGSPPYASAPYASTPYGAVPGRSGRPFGEPSTGGRPALAGWWRRGGGLVVDGIISGVVQVVVALVSADLARLVGLLVLVGFAYLLSTTGQTPGCRVVGVRVLRERDGGTLGWGAAVGRQFAHVLDTFPLFLGFLWPLWDARKQTFADKIVGSVVVRA